MPQSKQYSFLISRFEDGKIISSHDRRRQQYLNTGWSIVGEVTLSDDTIQVDWFDPNYEEKWCFKVMYFASMTTKPILKEWFASRPSFPTFGAWLKSSSVVK